MDTATATNTGIGTGMAIKSREQSETIDDMSSISKKITIKENRLCGVVMDYIVIME